MERSSSPEKRLLQVDVAPGSSSDACPSPRPLAALPLRCCLLSGGVSRRMGQDKALLPHPEGGNWLERTLRLLATTGVPLTLLTRWPQHRQLAAALRPELEAAGVALELLTEPEPAAGPLLALARLMEHHPDQRLLLCPVDMPGLSDGVLRALVAATDADPVAIHLADDGKRLQPLLGVYPSDGGHHRRLDQALAAGERRLLGWLGSESVRRLSLDPALIVNVNTVEELARHNHSVRSL